MNTLISKIANRLFGYNAIVDKGRRQSPKARTSSEDAVLKPKDRKKLNATTRDQNRNIPLFGWVVNRHVDYVSNFNLLVRTDDEALNKQIARLFSIAARKENFDIAGRSSRAEAMRLFEVHKVIDGDCLFIKTNTGHMQAIEADRICKPSDYKGTANVADTGLVLDKYGRVEQYCVCRRSTDGKKLEFDRLVPASDVIYDGYFTRFDQTRGISPLASAVNSFADLSECFEWTLLKNKLHALFGIAIKRDPISAVDGFQSSASAAFDTNADSSTTADPKFEISPSGGIFQLQLEPGDSIDTIESKTPNSEFITYSELIIRIALLALDIPYTFFNSAKASFSARIADRAEYEIAAARKRRKNKEVLRAYAEWKLSQWIADKTITTKIPFEELCEKIEWIPAGTPWLDKLNEIQADAKSVDAGFESRQQVCARHGVNFFEVCNQLAAEQKYMEDRGIKYTTGDPGQHVETGSNADKTEETENEKQKDSD